MNNCCNCNCHSTHGMHRTKNCNRCRNGRCKITCPGPSARVWNSAPIALADGVDVTLSFDTPRWDTGTPPIYLAGTPTRLTAPVTGKYQVTGNARFSVASATGDRRLYIVTNVGNVIQGFQQVSASGLPLFVTVEVSSLVSLNAGDFVELVAGQSNTALAAGSVVSTDNFSPSFMMVRVDG